MVTMLTNLAKQLVQLEKNGLKLNLNAIGQPVINSADNSSLDRIRET